MLRLSRISCDCLFDLPSFILELDKLSVDMDIGVRVATGLLALVTFTFYTTKSLHDAVSNYRSPQKVVKDLLTGLDGF